MLSRSYAPEQGAGLESRQIRAEGEGLSPHPSWDVWLLGLFPPECFKLEWASELCDPSLLGGQACRYLLGPWEGSVRGSWYLIHQLLFSFLLVGVLMEPAFVFLIPSSLKAKGTSSSLSI